MRDNSGTDLLLFLVCLQVEGLQFILAMDGFDPLPHADVAETRPSIVASIGQSADPQAAELLRHFRFYAAISDFPVIAPGAIGKVFAKHGPDGVVVANSIVGPHKLVGRRSTVHGRTRLRWLE